MAELRRYSIAVFAALCLLCGLAISAVIYSARSWEGSRGATKTPAFPGAVLEEWPADRIYFRHNLLGADYGQLAFIDRQRPERRQIVDQLSCEVVHVAGGRGLCLTADRGVVTTYSAISFDPETWHTLNEIPLAGVPSRARVSANGRTGAVTVFVTGHGYDSVDFSTQTLLIDMADGSKIADLETFAVFRDSRIIKNADFNFWGVTFTPDGRFFYATLSTRRTHLLVRGDIEARTAKVIHEGVECPSLSPDGTRIAFKRRRIGNRQVTWQLYILDLSARVETRLTEQRSVDDQLEWLDSDHVLYSVPNNESAASTDVWIANDDASGPPRIFLQGAYSPAVVR